MYGEGRIADLIQIFKKQTAEEPERCIVQTDHTVYLKMCPGIVPRAAVMFFQKASAHIFGGENKQHI